MFPELRKRFDVVVLEDLSVDDIRKRLATLPPDTLLFLSGQATDKGVGRALTPAENGRLITAVSPFPTYTFWDFHLNLGVIGGHIITGPKQGRLAAEMALSILGGMPADSIPIVMTTPTQDIFDYAVMRRFDIAPADLPVGATLINRPDTLWETYRWQIIGVVSLIVVEGLLIGLLLNIARVRRIALPTLAEERRNLELRVAERTRELQESNVKLDRLSNIDGLTNVANRRRFDEVLQIECARLGRFDAPFSLILLDVDYFKLFNDTYGHVAGDDCLKRIAAYIDGKANRATDLVALYGGEEFALILPGTDRPGAATFAEEIRKGIEALAIPHSTSSVADHVTVSLGVVTLLSSTCSIPSDAMQRVDEQLYIAKKSGRNRVAAMDASECNQ